jgi:uncharacterized protein YdaU (DUF1376 family)
MHYYQHNIADYKADTGHLSLLEHGVYRQLIDWYYLNESCIPTETELVFRRLCARTEEERNAVLVVLSEFFSAGESGYSHRRCDAEISSYKAKADRARDNGKLGGRPKKTKEVISGNRDQTQTKANHKPITNNQSISDAAAPQDAPPTASPKKARRLADDWVLPQAWGKWALGERKDWVADDVRKCADRFADYWHSKPGREACKLDWEATWRNWVRNDKTGGAGSLFQRPTAGPSFAGVL